MRENLFTALLAVMVLAACAAPKVELLPLEATIGQPLTITLYKVPT
jgi:hypothetical protein